MSTITYTTIEHTWEDGEFGWQETIAWYEGKPVYRAFYDYEEGEAEVHTVNYREFNRKMREHRYDIKHATGVWVLPLFVPEA